ncbi:MAG: hypothetical protein QMD92_07940, partial [bacterium]|nr:hypothetical protein [bacterium]
WRGTHKVAGHPQSGSLFRISNFAFNIQILKCATIPNYFCMGTYVFNAFFDAIRKTNFKMQITCNNKALALL